MPASVDAKPLIDIRNAGPQIATKMIAMSSILLPKNGQVHRIRQIGEVFARHGMGYLASIAGLDRFTRFPAGLLRPQRGEKTTQPKRLRMALEDLGTTFIKVGQLLSTRADLLAPEYLAELVKLQDATPPVPAGEVKSVLVAELGRPIEEVFATFDQITSNGDWYEESKIPRSAGLDDFELWVGAARGAALRIEAAINRAGR